MIGRTLGHYSILEKLGEGGMGEVYLAEDATLKRQVALKVLPTELASSRERLERFQREAESLAALNHPNIVHVYTVETDDGVHFLTMELVEGESLDRVITAEGLPLQQFFDLAIPLADALAEAHERGIVHRDLKPANVMVDRRGRPKILDFGLAKLRRTVPAELAREAPTEVMTQPGMVMGTYPYMSPEQAEGKEADHRSDLFSFGIVLYEMVTGERPFQGESPVSLISSILKDEPRPVFDVRSGLPEGLGRILARGLEKRPPDRYASAAELREALEKLRRVVESGVAHPVARESQVPGFLTEEGPEEPRAQIFVGRDDELVQLESGLKSILEGHGQVLFVTGEAGTGKTALVDVFVRMAQQQQEDLVVATGGCSAHTGPGDPYAPFRQILAQLTGDVETKYRAGTLTRRQAKRLWELLPASAEAITEGAEDVVGTLVAGDALLSRAESAAHSRSRWLGGVRSLVERKRSLPPDVTLRQSALVGQVSHLLQSLAAKKPLLVVLEDMHWVDTGSADLLSYLTREISGHRLLIVGTFRPSEVATGSEADRHPIAQLLNELERNVGQCRIHLGQADDRQFVDSLIDCEPNDLDLQFREDLFERTRGHALFTVELLETMRTRQMIVENEEGRCVASEQLDWSVLPIQVEGVIRERIDRLSDRLKDLLTIASVEGEDFTAEVLSKVRDIETREVVRLLGKDLERRHRLVSARGLKRINSNRLSLYRFLHVLFQKYLYEDLDEAERAYLHEDVGKVLEGLYGEQASEIAPQLARHFLEAGDLEKALQYSIAAGQQAVRMTANREAIAHYRKALDILFELPGSEKRNRLEVKIQTGLAAPLIATQGWASQELGTACGRVQDLTEDLGDDPELFPMRWFLGSYHGTRAQLREAIDINKQLLTSATQAGDPFHAAMAAWTIGVYQAWTGEISESQQHLRHAIEFFQPGVHDEVVYHYGLDPVGVTRLWYAHTLAYQGYLDRSREIADLALERARELGHPYNLGFSLGLGSTWLGWHIRDSGKCRFVDEVLQIARRNGFTEMLTDKVFAGYCTAISGDPLSGREIAQEGVEAAILSGYQIGMPLYRGLQSDIERLAGNRIDALRLVDEGLEHSDHPEHVGSDHELHRRKGELLDQSGGAAEEVEECFRKAIELCRPEKVRLWELRASVSYARFLRNRSRIDEARQILLPIYEWYTEGFDLPDLQEAKAMLEELG